MLADAPARAGARFPIVILLAVFIASHFLLIMCDIIIITGNNIQKVALGAGAVPFRDYVPLWGPASFGSHCRFCVLRCSSHRSTMGGGPAEVSPSRHGYANGGGAVPRKEAARKLSP